MGNYIDPFLSDEETIGRDSRLSKKRSREDYLAAQAQGGFDAAIHDSKRPIPTERWEGFLPIPGASRSGALDPPTRSRIEREEREGLIQVQRNAYGEIIAYRDIDHERGA
jgi:hypothetical protein